MIRGMRAEAGDRPGRVRKRPLPPYAEILGLNDWPFRETRHAWLAVSSRTAREALEELVRRLSGDDGVFLLAMPVIPGLEQPLGERVSAGLGEDFLAAALRADLLMTPEELLQQVVEALSLPLETGATPESLMEALGELVADSGGSLRGVVVQVEDAHELSADALEVLIELADFRFENAAFSTRVLLWGDEDLRDRLRYALSGRGLESAQVGIPAFTAEDVRAYLEYCLRQSGLRGEFPFTGEQVEAIHEASRALPGEIDRLAEAELERTAAALAGRSRRYPLGHTVAATVLLAVLVLLYSSFGEEEAAPRAEPAEALTRAAAGEAPAPVPAVAAPAENRPAAVALEPASAGFPVPVEEELDESASAAAAVAREDAPAAPPPAPAVSEAPPRAEAPAPVIAPPPREPTELERQHARIRAFPAEHVVAQMMGSFSRDGARQFIASHGVDDSFHYLRSEYQGRPWYVVVYGSFASRRQAEEALRRLPAAARQGEPWIRSAREIIGQIREGGE